MIELTEIVAEPGVYDPEAKNVPSTYCLKRLYINPVYVVEVRPSEELLEKHSRKELVLGLAPEVGFTKMTISTGGNWTKTYNIVGQLGHIVSLLESKRET